MRTQLALAALASGAALAAVGIAQSATTNVSAQQRLNGTIGPGYTISLENGQGKVARTLVHGKFTLVVEDKANIHNFTLDGPGIDNRTISGTSFTGKKTVTVTLAKGTYRFYCTIHPDVSGTVKVT